MEKKRYYRPTSKLIPIDTTEILAGSTEMLEKGVKGDPDEPERDEYGWITIE